ncbi:MAG: DUF423 domain-containing protein [Bryobacteraceae bacterium]|jgi:uncharacterized membrane protein YgdD (TMEM256/DUF423 family)
MNWSAVAAFLLALAVALGAFGAHGLKSHLDAYLMGVWEKAVFYHFVHALGLLLTGLAARAGVLRPNAASRVGWLLLAGIVLFSGSLYTLALSRMYVLGALTPLGGLSFIAAWLWLGVELLRSKS